MWYGFFTAVVSFRGMVLANRFYRTGSPPPFNLQLRLGHPHGKHYTAQLRGKWFVHAPEGEARSWPELFINYVTWGGTKWSAVLLPDGRTFRHTSESGQVRETDVLNYIHWSSQEWGMRIVP
jgi:hypothetical protein